MNENKITGLPFARLGHIGIVVKDLENTRKIFSSLGAVFEEGRQPPRFIEEYYRGNPADFKIKLALAHVGAVSIEIFEPVSGASPHQEFLDLKGEGIHHFGFDVDDVQAGVDNLVQMGARVIANGRTANTEFAYLEMKEPAGMVVELLHRH